MAIDTRTARPALVETAAMTLRTAFRFRPSRGWRALALALVPAALLAGCSATPGAPAGMLRGADAGLSPYGAGPVEIVTLDARTVGAHLHNPVSTDPSAWVYRLGPGDMLQLHVVDEPELTLPTGYLVEPDGAIQVPYLGRVPVSGQSAEQVRASITDRLRAYRAAPQVDVRITAFNARHVSVVGAVNRPSRLPLTTTPLTVIDAINAAAGLTPSLHRPRVTLLRAGQRHPVDMEAFLTTGRALPVLQDGDVVQVDTGGALPRNATPVRLQDSEGNLRAIPAEGAALASVVSRAGIGQGDTAYVLRAHPGGGRLQALHFDAGMAMDPAVGGRFALAAGDTVVLARGRVADAAAHQNALAPALRQMAR